MIRQAFRGFDGGGVFKFRILKPGSTADARYASVDDCLLHEQMLATQPYWLGFVPCPFAGSTTKDPLDQTTNVSIPDAGVTDPEYMLWPRNVSGRNCFPRPASVGVGNSQDGYPSEAWAIRMVSITANTLTLRFIKPALSTQSPLGCSVALFKRG
ncbi:hypothetical protein [Mesorhizobium sp. Pch-S]|uniref:hypothetical protein n=1 Tax=Mesorhizobium sp. Pch-S TaxID=2082387 RepID=UPI0010105F76|nr:hypothetical protein [Mesorhizobium sp. Pch-S]QAZ46151.1 hypothetical protein C1M53_27705 [Mesorhizobium sp. Pch-S]